MQQIKKVKIKDATGTTTLATASYTTASAGGTVPNSGVIATDLKNDLATALPSGWTFTVDDYIIRIERNDDTDFILEFVQLISRQIKLVIIIFCSLSL